MKSSSSSRWKQRQGRDPFVLQARREGWRSRAVFKLQEIQTKERLMRHGAVVVDLGAAPGSWSQYAATCVGPEGRVIAVDVLDMELLPSVEFLQGDFTEAAVMQQLLKLLDGTRVDLVLSDMAPNITGNKSVDQPRSMYLGELALDFAAQVLRLGGHLVSKLFQGQGYEDLVAETRRRFDIVKHRKPRASRPDSPEMYLVARGFRL